MRTRHATPIALALIVAACAQPADDAPAEAPEMSDEEAIAALGDYWETHFNMQHPEMVASKYLDDAWVAPADGGWFEGEEQVQGWLAETSAPAPTASIDPVETVVMGDKAFGMGRYAIVGTGPDGNPMEFSGAYMNALSKVGGEWMIQGSMTNYDEARPDGWEWNAMPDGDAPPDVDNQFSEMVEAFETAWNAQDAAGLGAMFTEGSMAAFSDGPIMMGRGGVESGMAERLQPGVTIEIHQVNADQIDESHWGSGGWYEMQGPDGSTVQTGLWWNVFEMQDDGSPLIHWSISNAFPMAL